MLNMMAGMRGVGAHGVDLRQKQSRLDNDLLEHMAQQRFSLPYGNFVVTHWMPVRPAVGVDTDWHAMARPDAGS